MLYIFVKFSECKYARKLHISQENGEKNRSLQKWLRVLSPSFTLLKAILMNIEDIYSYHKEIYILRTILDLHTHLEQIHLAPNI